VGVLANSSLTACHISCRDSALRFLLRTSRHWQITRRRAKENVLLYRPIDRLCGLVVRVPGYRSRGPGFDSRRYLIFWEVVGLERGPLSLVNTTEELLERNSSGSGLENREYGRGDLLHWPRDTLYPQKLALLVGIVRLRTKTTEFEYRPIRKKKIYSKCEI
jgi:hypothetical protein